MPPSIPTFFTPESTDKFPIEDEESPEIFAPSSFTSTLVTFVSPESSTVAFSFSTETFVIAESHIVIDEPPFTTIETLVPLLFFIVTVPLVTLSEITSVTFCTLSRTTSPEFTVSVFPPKSPFLMTTPELTDASSENF